MVQAVFVRHTKEMSLTGGVAASTVTDEFNWGRGGIHGNKENEFFLSCGFDDERCSLYSCSHANANGYCTEQVVVH